MVLVAHIRLTQRSSLGAFSLEVAVCEFIVHAFLLLRFRASCLTLCVRSLLTVGLSLQDWCCSLKKALHSGIRIELEILCQFECGSDVRTVDPRRGMT